MTRFFEDFQPYYRDLQSGNFSEALDRGIIFLEQAKDFSQAQYQQIHKGTPFYFLGIAAFRCHDYETAAFLMDAALSEDMQNHATNTDTPAQNS